MSDISAFAETTFLSNKQEGFTRFILDKTL